MIVLVVKVTRHLVVEDSFMVVLDHTITFRRVCGRQSYSSTECHMVRAKSITFSCVYVKMCRSQWPHGLRRRSAAAVLLRSWVRIPPGAWMFVCCECCVLSGRGLCDELITRPFLPTVVRRCVRSRNLKNEEAMSRVGSQRYRKKRIIC